MTMLYRTVYHVLPGCGHVLNCCGPCFTCIEPNCTGSLTMWYRSLCHMLLVRPHVLTGPYRKGLLTKLYRLYTMRYRTVDSLYRDLDHELPCPGPYCTVLLSMWFRDIYHMLSSRGHLLQAEDTFYRPWTMSYRALNHRQLTMCY